MSFKHYINVRKNRKSNQEWTIQREWQHWVHKIQDEDKQTQKCITENKKDEQHGPLHKPGVS